ncbi:MAG: hypothetical protein NC485_12260 [Ruminococcus flavefaciens]|nr:hypothetical protein [Ruminococcus flavefaciens]MCM1060092.1 hypothetical protein [Eubacterium sp.]
MNEKTMIKNTLTKIGDYKAEYNNKLGLKLPLLGIYQDTGLYKHIANRHPNCLQYLNKTTDILLNPDYIGYNQKNKSVEFVKKFSDNIEIAIKLDYQNGYYYISTLFDITKSKLSHRIASGEFKKF